MKTYENILNGIEEVLDFNFITAKNKAEKKIYLNNINGNKDILFVIVNNKDFQITPSEGILYKNSIVEVLITVFPNQAEVQIANLKIILDKTVSKVVKMSFISKYPQIKLNRTNLDFGNILINQVKELDLIIKNQEKVPAKFEVDRTSPEYIPHQNSFHLKDSKGEIPPNCSFLLKIKFIPMYPEVFSYESFQVRINGGTSEYFNCFGRCKGLSASLSSKHVNFDSVELGAKTSRVIRVYNHSEIDSEFQFYYQNDGVFKFEPRQGKINAKSNERITVSFNPKENISYYDRCFCLFRNHILFVSSVNNLIKLNYFINILAS